MAVSVVSRIALLCMLVAASAPLVRAGCTTKDACPAGQCCGGAVIMGRCVGIGCTCFCPATSGDFKCMVDASTYLSKNPGELAKCGKNAVKSISLVKGCASADFNACKDLGKQMLSLGRKL